MDRGKIFQILEIDPTDDKRAIKKAYARLVKQYHPEENPEKWKEIHDAYMEALKTAEQDSYAAPMQVPVSDAGKVGAEVKVTQQQTVSDEEAELEVLFDKVKQLAAQHQAKEDIIQEEKFCQMLEELKALLEKKTFDRQAWEKLLKPDNMIMMTEREDFIYRFGFCFLHHSINVPTWSFLKGQLRELSERYQDESETSRNSDAIQEAINYVEQKIDSAHYASVGKMASEETKRYKIKPWQVLIIAGIGIVVIWAVLVLGLAVFL